MTTLNAIEISTFLLNIFFKIFVKRVESSVCVTKLLVCDDRISRVEHLISFTPAGMTDPHNHLSLANSRTRAHYCRHLHTFTRYIIHIYIFFFRHNDIIFLKKNKKT